MTGPEGGCKRFNLPKDYYVQVHPLITLTVVAILWVLFPTFAFCPNALDFAVNDSVGDFIEGHRFNLVKLFNAQVWVRQILKGFDFAIIQFYSFR